MLRFMNPANLLTLAGLGSALASALFALNGELVLSVIALICAGLADLFDGLVARRLKRTPEEERFGARLDSAVDACSFGFAPAILLYAAGMRSPAELALLFALAAAAVWRLAWFDTVPAPEGPGRYTEGLPTTYVALVVPLAFLAGFNGPVPLRIAANASAILLALAMVGRFKLRKPWGLWYGVLGATAIGLVVIYLVFAGSFGRR